MNKLGYYIKEGFLSIFTHGFMSFVTVTIIIACLIIMGSFSLLAVNVDANIRLLKRKTIYLLSWMRLTPSRRPELLRAK